MIYLQLFLSFLKIGFFGFGGGYAMLTLIESEIVSGHAWLSAAQLTDIVAISQMTPGPIAINCATYVGYTVTGNVWGSALATFAVCLPALTLMMLIVTFYTRLRNNPYVKNIVMWLRPLTVGMIGAAALMLLTPETFTDWKSIVIFAVVAVATWFRADSIIMILLAAAAGIILY